MKLHRDIEQYTDEKLKSLHSGMWLILAISFGGLLIFVFVLFSNYISQGAQLDFNGYKLLIGMIAGLVLTIFIFHALFYKIKPTIKSRNSMYK